MKHRHPRKRTLFANAALCNATFEVALANHTATVETTSYRIERDLHHYAIFHLYDGDRTVPCYVTVTPEYVDVAFNGYTYRFRIFTQREHELFQIVQSAQQQEHRDIVVRAPMPGLIKTVTVEPGLHIEHGHRLCILEAMKMENEILSPQSGIVKKVLVKANQPVDKNTILCVIEPER